MLDPTSISSPTFNCTSHEDGERVVLVARGELDLATVPHLEQAVQDVRTRGARAVVLDLRELGFMDSTGVRMLLQLDAESRANGFAFSIMDSEGPVRRVLTLTGVADHLRYTES
jgi:anti-sigma B factor antagonist